MPTKHRKVRKFTLTAIPTNESEKQEIIQPRLVPFNGAPPRSQR